jgi:geranyl-CoA carboxylase alpha subunit
MTIDGKQTWIQCLQRKGRIYIEHEGEEGIFEDITYAPAEPKGTAGANVIRAPMAGRVVKVMAEPGQAVAKNQVLVILEAMKMEHELKAAADGTVETVTAKPGDQVAIRQTLVTLSAPVKG